MNAFSFNIAFDERRRRRIAFINWKTEKGESISAGVIYGFNDPQELHEAAQVVVDALNENFGFAQ